MLFNRVLPSLPASTQALATFIPAITTHDSRTPIHLRLLTTTQLMLLVSSGIVCSGSLLMGRLTRASKSSIIISSSVSSYSVSY